MRRCGGYCSDHVVVGSRLLLPQGLRGSTGNNVGPPAAVIEGNVRSLQVFEGERRPTACEGLREVYPSALGLTL